MSDEEQGGAVDGRVTARQLNVPRTTDGQWAALRATRDGSLIYLPWYQALVLEGRVHEAFGAGSQVTTSTTGTVALADATDADSDLFVDVPAGLALIPLEVRFSTQVTSPTISANVAIKWWAFLSDTLNGLGGSETTVTVRPLNRAAPSPSGATAAQVASGEADHVTGGEVHLFKDVTEFDMDGAVGKGMDNNRYWSARRTGVTPVGLDGSSLNLVLLTPDVDDTTTVWTQSIWAEVAQNNIT